jgi:hypothetical protein
LDFSEEDEELIEISSTFKSIAAKDALGAINNNTKC